MAHEDLYTEFLKKLKADKTEEQMAEFLAGAMKFGAAQLMTAIFYFLTVEDMEEVEKEKNQKIQEDIIREKFKLRTGVTTIEFMQKLRDTISKNYLFPELNPQKKSSWLLQNV